MTDGQETVHTVPVAGDRREPRVWPLVMATVLGLIVVRLIAPSSEPRQLPGEARGDLVLSEDALPQTLAGWTRERFEPAPKPDTLPPGQYWWVHQWQFSAGEDRAVISFDQLGENKWHELTYCYRVVDWTIEDRQVHFDPADEGPYVVAVLRHPDGQHAVLAFSVFYEDGTWATPPAVSLLQLNEKTGHGGILQRAQERIRPVITMSDELVDHERALQCQVFLSGIREVGAEHLNAATQLHLQSRQRFREQWMLRK